MASSLIRIFCGSPTIQAKSPAAYASRSGCGCRSARLKKSSPGTFELCSMTAGKKSFESHQSLNHSAGGHTDELLIGRYTATKVPTAHSRTSELHSKLPRDGPAPAELRIESRFA